MKKTMVLISLIIAIGASFSCAAEDSELYSMVQKNKHPEFRDSSVVMKYCMASSQVLYFAGSYINIIHDTQDKTDPVAVNIEGKFNSAADFLKLSKKQREVVIKSLMDNPSQMSMIMNSGNSYYDSCCIDPQEYIINYQYLVMHQNS